MKIDRDGALAKWAYMWDDFGAPERTSLCALFWRTVLLTPLIFLLMISVFCICAYLIISAIVIAWKAILIALGIIAGLWLVGWLLLEYLSHGYTGTVAQMPIVQGYKSIKAKVCPIVEFYEVEEEEDLNNLDELPEDYIE